MDSYPIRISSSSEAILQASKWLNCPMLIDAEEMIDLFKTLDPFALFVCGSICNEGKEQLPKEEFLDIYQKYTEDLKEGRQVNINRYRSYFSSLITRNTDPLFAIEIGNKQRIIRIAKPVIQMQALNIDYSPLDKKFRTMVFGINSITWGIQFSYPQLFQDDQTKNIQQVKDKTQFPNTEIFEKLQKWMRRCTIPTPFNVEGTRYHVPIRIGKMCLSWINHHPQLMSKGIQVG